MRVSAGVKSAPSRTRLHLRRRRVLGLPEPSADIAEQPTDSVGILEDGFVLLITNATWNDIRDHLASGPQNWGLRVTGHLGFRLKTTGA